MQIEERRIRDVTILDIKGKLTLGLGDQMLKEKIDTLVAAGQIKVVLNLEESPYVDPVCLGEIVRSYTKVARQGGTLKLLAIQKQLEDLMKITKLYTVFDIFANQKEALASFSKNPTAT